MQTFRPRITLDGETPSPMNHLQCRPWNQASRAGADENPKADAVFALSGFKYGKTLSPRGWQCEGTS